MSTLLVKQTASVTTIDPLSDWKKSRRISESLVLVQDLENRGGKLILAPKRDFPDVISLAPTSALMEGPNSMPKPVVEARVLPIDQN